MTYAVEITDHWTECPGTIIRHGFRYKRAARLWADREVAAAREMFTDARAKLTVRIVREG